MNLNNESILDELDNLITAKAPVQSFPLCSDRDWAVKKSRSMFPFLTPTIPTIEKFMDNTADSLLGVWNHIGKLDKTEIKSKVVMQADPIKINTFDGVHATSNCIVAQYKDIINNSHIDITARTDEIVQAAIKDIKARLDVEIVSTLKTLRSPPFPTGTNIGESTSTPFFANLPPNDNNINIGDTKVKICGDASVPWRTPRVFWKTSDATAQNNVETIANAEIITLKAELGKYKSKIPVVAEFFNLKYMPANSDGGQSNNEHNFIDGVGDVLKNISSDFLFELNNPTTRNIIKKNIESNFYDLVNEGSLYDYAVVCDETNNSPSNVGLKKIVVDVTIKRSPAGEFTYMPLQIKASPAECSKKLTQKYNTVNDNFDRAMELIK